MTCPAPRARCAAQDIFAGLLDSIFSDLLAQYGEKVGEALQTTVSLKCPPTAISLESRPCSPVNPILPLQGLFEAVENIRIQQEIQAVERERAAAMRQQMCELCPRPGGVSWRAGRRGCGSRPRGGRAAWRGG